MAVPRVDELRARWDRAVERDRPGDALAALAELERLEPHEPRWAQRLGESLRRVGRAADAEAAFIRAMDGFLAAGFVPRAVAMAKLVAAMNPARTDLLVRVADRPKPADAALVWPGTATTAPLPQAPAPVRPVPLERAKDESAVEVRFSDAEESSIIELMLEDIDVVVDDVPEDASSLPMPREPSIDRMATMAAFRLFAGLQREPLLELSAAAELVEFMPGAMVIVRDEPAFALYAIVGGTVRVSVPGSSAVRLGEGDVFGESCLLGEGQRQADVRAETALMTLRIAKSALDAVTRQYPEVEDVIFHLLARRLVANLMQSSPLFTVFEAKVRLEFAQMFEVRRAAAGTSFAEQGRSRDGLYVLLAGNVTATDGTGRSVRVPQGTTFGHGALLGNAPSDVTVRAITDSVVLRLPAARFASLAAFYPPALAFLAELTDEPFRRSTAP